MDYRDLEDRSADLQAKAEAIRDKAKGRELSAAEQDKVDSFEMNATSYALSPLSGSRRSRPSFATSSPTATR